ncbi:MAG: radical SAM protein [Bryobacteraceae bacterium]
MKPLHWLAAWGTILKGRAPMLSIEITRECPLSCPGCYAYGEEHLGGGVTLSQLNDYRGDDLVNGVMGLIRKHDPLHISLVGGEPLIRHKELSRVLPQLSEMGKYVLVVTSAVIPIPEEWMKLARLTVAVSIDGLPPEHDVRRKPATYERILRNVEGRRINIHTTVTQQMLSRDGYMEEFLGFWCARPELNSIWLSTYTPQVGEQSPEMLTLESRRKLAEDLPRLKQRFPQMLMTPGIANAILEPPRSPSDCIFSKMSVNYSADLKSRVEPCIFGGNPDCTQCGCAVSSGFHWAGNLLVAGPFHVSHIMNGSIKIGSVVNRIQKHATDGMRWHRGPQAPDPKLTQIQM